MKVVDWFQHGRKGPNGCMKFAVFNFGPFHGAKKPVQTANHHRSGFSFKKANDKIRAVFFSGSLRALRLQLNRKGGRMTFSHPKQHVQEGAPLTTISGFIPCYTHLQPWLNRVCWGYNYLITRGGPSCIKKL